MTDCNLVQISFGALAIGFALSEMWRAPAAIMIRETAPHNAASTSSAIHLCFRNLLAASGPLGVALLSERLGLQQSMLLVPACYAVSGLLFLVAEGTVQGQLEESVAG